MWVFADRTCSKILLRFETQHFKTDPVCVFIWLLWQYHRSSEGKLRMKLWNWSNQKLGKTFAITGRSFQFVHAFSRPSGLFFLSVDLYSLYSSSCSLPIFLFLQPLFLICLYQLAIWRTCTFPLKIYGAMSHVRKAKTRFGLRTPTTS